MKARREKITCLTAYDATFAQAVDAAELPAVPGWRGLRGFVDGALRAQLVAALAAEDAEHVLARIHGVLACVLSPEDHAHA